MPFNSNDPLGYLGINEAEQPVFLQFQRPPTTNDKYPAGSQIQDLSSSAKTIYETTGGGVWLSGANSVASTTATGIVQIATLTELQTGTAPADYYVPSANDVATVIAGVVVGAVPPATEIQAGIAEIATQAETDAGADDTRIVSPLKLANFIASGGFPGVFTDLTATGTVSFTGATGGIVMTSATASSFGTTGAGIDLTLDSAAGRVIVNGEEAAANAITLLSAAGGIDVDAALQINIASSQSAVDAIRIVASAGGIDIDAVGAAGEDINITNTGASIVLSATESAADAIVINATLGGIDILASGASAGEDIDIIATGSSVNITSTENDAGAIYIHANGGASEVIRLHSDQGTSATSVYLLTDVGGITLEATGDTSADAINITASAGGIDVDSAAQLNMASSQNAVDAIRIVASAGGIDIDAVGAATEDINITNTGGSVVIVATESAADSIVIHSTLGGIDILASGASAGEDIDIIATGSSVNISATESAADSITIVSTAGGIDILASGAAAGEDIDIVATGSSVNIQATESDVNAITINASGVAGGINVDAGTGGVIVDTTGAISLDSAAASNFTVTGAFDLTLSSSAGSVVITGAEGAADAVQLNALTALGGIDMNAGSGGVTIDTTAAISLDSATASNFTVTGAADLTLASSAGAVNVTSGEANADSINVTSAGGMNVVATGASAKDTIITNTNGSMTLTAGESVTDAMNITASGAASRVNITAGTGSIKFASGLIVPLVTKTTANTPYTVLGTDYFISCDTSGGVLTVTLPDAAALAGRTFVIRDTAGSAAVNNITIGTAGGNLVGGGAAAATKVLSAAYSGATVYSNGVTWNYAYTA